MKPNIVDKLGIGGIVYIRRNDPSSLLLTSFHKQLYSHCGIYINSVIHILSLTYDTSSTRLRGYSISTHPDVNSWIEDPLISKLTILKLKNLVLF